jgi:hypothetical protein
MLTPSDTPPYRAAGVIDRPVATVAIAAELGDLPLALHLADSFLETYRDDPRVLAIAG